MAKKPERIVLTTFMGNMGSGGITFSFDGDVQSWLDARIGYKPWFLCSTYYDMTLVLEVGKKRRRDPSKPIRVAALSGSGKTTQEE